LSSSHAVCQRLRGVSRPQFRLRVDEIRVFYDVSESVVEILSIVSKSEAEAWLEKVGEQNEADSTS
jgi:mRNA interferase RelE/StbE